MEKLALQCVTQVTFFLVPQHAHKEFSPLSRRAICLIILIMFATFSLDTVLKTKTGMDAWECLVLRWDTARTHQEHVSHLQDMSLHVLIRVEILVDRV